MVEESPWRLSSGQRIASSSSLRRRRTKRMIAAIMAIRARPPPTAIPAMAPVESVSFFELEGTAVAECETSIV